MGVQTDILDGLSNSQNIVSMEDDLSHKLNTIWALPGGMMSERNLISRLFVTCSAEFCSLSQCMNFPFKTNLDSWPNRSISDDALHEGMSPPQSVDAAKVSRFYEILMKVTDVQSIILPLYFLKSYIAFPISPDYLFYQKKKKKKKLICHDNIAYILSNLSRYI